MSRRYYSSEWNDSTDTGRCCRKITNKEKVKEKIKNLKRDVKDLKSTVSDLEKKIENLTNIIDEMVKYQPGSNTVKKLEDDFYKKANQ